MSLSSFSLRVATVGVALAVVAGAASAQAITPTYTTSFGFFDPATFGGTGIPNQNVALSVLDSGTMLGLSATQRCAGNPQVCGAALTNNGMGSFTAQAGSPQGDATASWNFGWYLSNGTVASRTFKLFYDFDPAVSNAQSTHGTILFGNLGGTGQTNQGSQNLGFGFLAGSPALSYILPPSSPTSFDKDALGTYTFALVAYNAGGAELGRSAIEVTVVPEPEAYGLALAGMGVVAFAMRRRRPAA